MHQALTTSRRNSILYQEISSLEGHVDVIKRGGRTSMVQLRAALQCKRTTLMNVHPYILSLIKSSMYAIFTYRETFKDAA